MNPPELVTIGGARVSCARSPRPGAPTLVMLSPWPLTLESFRGVWPALSAAYELIALDLPGFGHSDVPAEPTSPSSLARFLLAAFDHFALERAHLLGTDVGVPIALAFAEQHPARLRSLVLSDGPGTIDPVLGADLRRMVGSRAFRWLFAASPWMFVKTAVRNGYRRRAPTPAQLADYIAACRTPRLLAGTLAFLATYPAELPAIDAGLAAMAVPTLLLWGGSDVYVPPDNAHALHARLPRSEVVVLDGAGHFSHDDDPDGYAAAVVAWCAKHGVTPGPRS